MRVLRLALVGLLYLAILACDGSWGALGNRLISYECTGPSDPYCDFRIFDPYCDHYSCNAPVESFGDPEVPDGIAVGGSFVLKPEHQVFDGDPGRRTTLFPASSEMLSMSGDNFRALEPGEVAVMATQAGEVEDYIYLTLREPVRVRVDRLDEQSVLHGDLQQLDLPLGTETWLRATPRSAAGDILYGAAGCTWDATDPAVVSFKSDTSDNLVRVSADATGMSRITVTLGAVSTSFELNVVDLM